MSTDMEAVAIAKGRKIAASSGGKSWSDDEEVYLLQARLRKVPYKIIATQLEKTELACRLHYHQLSHGGNRRKRTNSMSSSDSSPSNHSVLDPLRRSISPPRSCSSPIDTMKVLQRSTSGFQALNSPPPSDDRTGQTSDIIQSPISSSSSKHKRVKRTLDNVDRDKLDQLVKTHTEKLWTAVAAEYGEEYSAEMLEKAWKKKIVKRTTPTTTPPIKTSAIITTSPVPPPPSSSTLIVAQDVITELSNNRPTSCGPVQKEELPSAQSDAALQQLDMIIVPKSDTVVEATASSLSAEQTQSRLAITSFIASPTTSPTRPTLPSISTIKESSPRQPVSSPTEPTANALSEKCRISMPSGMCDGLMINAK